MYLDKITKNNLSEKLSSLSEKPKKPKRIDKRPKYDFLTHQRNKATSDYEKSKSDEFLEEIRFDKLKDKDPEIYKKYIRLKNSLEQTRDKLLEDIKNVSDDNVKSNLLDALAEVKNELKNLYDAMRKEMNNISDKRVGMVLTDEQYNNMIANADKYKKMSWEISGEMPGKKRSFTVEEEGLNKHMLEEVMKVLSNISISPRFIMKEHIYNELGLDYDSLINNEQVDEIAKSMIDRVINDSPDQFNKELIYKSSQYNTLLEKVKEIVVDNMNKAISYVMNQRLSRYGLTVSDQGDAISISLEEGKATRQLLQRIVLSHGDHIAKLYNVAGFNNDFKKILINFIFTDLVNKIINDIDVFRNADWLSARLNQEVTNDLLIMSENN